MSGDRVAQTIEVVRKDGTVEYQNIVGQPWLFREWFCTRVDNETQYAAAVDVDHWKVV